jgi:hypothetical protein
MDIINGDISYDALKKFVNAVEYCDTRGLKEWMEMTGDEAEADGIMVGGQKTCHDQWIPNDTLG